MSQDFSIAALSALGWKPFFLSSLNLAELEQFTLGRVNEVHRGRYRILTDQHEYSAELPGRFLHQCDTADDFPTVGDWVLLESPQQAEIAIIRRLLPRFSYLVRTAAGPGSERQPLCANVDTVLIVCSLNHDWNLARLERYLTLVREAKVTPVVLFSKADLCDDPTDLVEQSRLRLHLDEIIAIDLLNQDAREILAPWLTQGATLAVLGSSGVGKSTLINNLSNAERQQTQLVREDDDKGRHTTTRRSLIQLAGGICIIDTPGMRELQLSGNDAALNENFSDISILMEKCRFSNCTHHNEPGCAIVNALATGQLNEKRWISYQNLLREQQRQSELSEAGYKRRQKQKALGKMYKQVQMRKKGQKYQF